MKNLYSILFAAASMMPLSASAGFDLPEENSVLQSEDYGYRLEKNYDFVGVTLMVSQCPYLAMAVLSLLQTKQISSLTALLMSFKLPHLWK